MAFISMLMVFGVFLLIIVAIMAVLFIAGIILLIIGIVTKKQNKDKIYPTVLITIGSFLMGVVIIAVLAFAILIILNSFT